MKWFLVFSTEEGCPPLTVPIIAEGGCRKKFKLFATGYFFCYLIYFFCFKFTFLALTPRSLGQKRRGAFPFLQKMLHFAATFCAQRPVLKNNKRPNRPKRRPKNRRSQKSVFFCKNHKKSRGAQCVPARDPKILFFFFLSAYLSPFGCAHAPAGRGTALTPR